MTKDEENAIVEMMEMYMRKKRKIKEQKEIDKKRKEIK
jgi:hypothetical protein